MSARHTPNPWKSLNNCEANRLIAAAPDLLEALRLLQDAVHELRLLDVKKRFSLCLADAAAGKAIAKAEGRAS